MQAIQLPRSPNLSLKLFDPCASSSGDFSVSAADVTDDFSHKLRLRDETPAPIDQPTPENQGLNEGSLGSEKAAVAEDDDGDFSFAPNSPDSSPVSADELFLDGLIRPAFPLFGSDLLLDSAAEDQPPTSLRPPLKKMFSQQRDPMAPFSPEILGERSGKSAAAVLEESSATVCKKSNSTGFSKLWRFRDIVRRSNSDGKDAFVFLNPSTTATATAKATNKSAEKKKMTMTTTTMTKSLKIETPQAPSEEKKAVKAKAGKGTRTASSASLKTPKRRSYLPYRIGFFTNVDGMSRNVHPF